MVRLRDNSVALMDDSDEHIEVRTSLEGKVLQCDHQEKNPPRHGVDFFASLWRRKTGPSKVSRASESHQVSVQGPEEAVHVLGVLVSDSYSVSQRLSFGHGCLQPKGLRL